MFLIKKKNHDFKGNTYVDVGGYCRIWIILKNKLIFSPLKILQIVKSQNVL